MGPWSLRSRRRTDVWLKRGLLLLLPATVLASSFVVTNVPATQKRDVLPLVPDSVHVASLTPLRMAWPSTTDYTDILTAPKAMDPAVLPLGIHHIVLDAGHGGSDPGTSATSHVKEKEVTLDIERRLKALLETASFHVSTTRESDLMVPLKERARIANAAGADVFVSIHVNSIHSARNRGVETYYLGPTDDPVLTKLAAAENQRSGYSLGDYRKLIEGIYADARQGESHRLAQLVQAQMFSSLKAVNPQLEDWGVRRAPFLVLVATEMPAILAEVSCLSNDEEALLLETPKYRQKIAESLFLGIRAYADSHNLSKEKGT
ncbi:MAG TPA: N-acetylmuramoyl-L-alanine amidase [Thermoanaerobaculia bacterium]|nr:N-acetylmuramoyl-L-alanine amidase [Thermoanaerobaculia bacterium]